MAVLGKSFCVRVKLSVQSELARISGKLSHASNKRLQVIGAGFRLTMFVTGERADDTGTVVTANVLADYKRHGWMKFIVQVSVTELTATTLVIVMRIFTLI